MFTEKKASSVIRRATALALAYLVVGCAGTLDDPQSFLDGSTTADAGVGSAACGDVPTTLFAARCATAGCHDATTSTSSLDLASPDLATRIRGKSAMGGAGVLLDPAGDPQKSVLYLKVSSAPPFGSRMPLGSSLSDADLACVAAWIASTATSSTPTTTMDAAGAADAGGTDNVGDAGDPDAPGDP